MNKPFNTCFLFILMCLITLLSGCSQDDNLNDLREFMHQVKKTHTPAAVAPKKLNTQTAFIKPVTYQANQTRTPFSINTGLAASTAKALTPLQAFPVTILKFVGTAEEGNDIIAYILTPNNMIYQARKGDIIGEHDGKIINIQPTILEIEEHNTGDDGKETKVIVLQIKDRDE